MVKVNIDIPDTLHKYAKSQAALDGMLLKDFIILSIKERLDK